MGYLIIMVIWSMYHASLVVHIASLVYSIAVTCSVFFRVRTANSCIFPSVKGRAAFQQAWIY